MENVEKMLNDMPSELREQMPDGSETFFKQLAIRLNNHSLIGQVDREQFGKIVEHEMIDLLNSNTELMNKLMESDEAKNILFNQFLTNI